MCEGIPEHQALVRDRRGNGPVRSADRDLVVSIDRARQAAAVGCGNRSHVPRPMLVGLDGFKAGARRVGSSGHPRCQVHKVLCAMATCYVSAVRSLSTQPARGGE